MGKKIDSHLEKIDNKLEMLSETLIRNTSSLEEHMKRSAANEEAVQLLAEELKPVKNHVMIVEAIGKGIAWFCSCGVGIYLIEKFLK